MDLFSGDQLWSTLSEAIWGSLPLSVHQSSLRAALKLYIIPKLLSALGNRRVTTHKA